MRRGHRFGKQHLGFVLLNLLFQRFPLFALGFEFLQDADHDVRVVEHPLGHLRRGVHAMAADGGDHLVSDPALEGSRFGLPGAEDEGV